MWHMIRDKGIDNWLGAAITIKQAKSMLMLKGWEHFGHSPQV